MFQLHIIRQLTTDDNGGFQSNRQQKSFLLQVVNWEPIYLCKSQLRSCWKVRLTIVLPMNECSLNFSGSWRYMGFFIAATVAPVAWNWFSVRGVGLVAEEEVGDNNHNGSCDGGGEDEGDKESDGNSSTHRESWGAINRPQYSMILYCRSRNVK